jgi:hypothetical protein
MNGIPKGLRSVKGYIPWAGKVKRKREENRDSCRIILVGCGFFEL